MKALPEVFGQGGLSRYLQEIRKFPLLDPGEEYMLAKRWHEDGDPDRGFRLSTYAVWWIRAAIQQYILHSWSLVKMGTTAAQKKLFFNLRKLKGQIEAIEEGDLTPENVRKIAKELDVPEADVISMNRRLVGPDRSLNAPMRADGDTEEEWQDWLVDERADPEDTVRAEEQLRVRRDLLQSALGSLGERERRILFERRISDTPKTLDDLSKIYGVTRERIRQLEERAFKKVEQHIKSRISQRRLVLE